MAYEIIDNKDAIWSKFQVGSLTKNLIWSDAHIMTVAKEVLNLHHVSPVKWLKFDYLPLPSAMEIKFMDDRIWKVVFHDRNPDGFVSYSVDGGQQWRRSEIINGITPVTNAVLQAFVANGYDTIDIRPR